MDEIWQPVVGYEQLYEVSNTGKVRGLKRGKILKPAMGRECLVVRLSNGTAKTHSLHRIVAKAFMVPEPGKTNVCHNDGDYTNNHVENLRWDTQSSNMQDKIIHGTNFFANKTHCIRNHEFTESNTYTDKLGKRKCRACVKIRRKKGEPLNG